MRILHILNVSNGERLTADSGWIFAELIGSELLKRGHDFIVAGPAPIREPSSEFVKVDAPVGKYAARFGFSFADLLRAVRDAEPTHILVNQPEIVPEVRAAILEARGTAVVGCYCHYVPFLYDEYGELIDCPSLNDCGLGRSVRIAFLSGIAASDFAFVHSSTARKWIEQASQAHSLVIPRLQIAPPPCDPTFRIGPCERDGSSHSRTEVVYSHRLYEHYGTAQFLRMADQIVDHLGLTVDVTDVLGDRSPSRSRLDTSPDWYRESIEGRPGINIVDGSNRHLYRETVRRALVVLAPFRPGSTWSMSCIDAQGLGVPVIAPKMPWYEEHIDDRLLFSTDQEGLALIGRLHSDREFWEEMSGISEASTGRLGPSLVADLLEAGFSV